MISLEGLGSNEVWQFNWTGFRGTYSFGRKHSEISQVVFTTIL